MNNIPKPKTNLILIAGKIMIVLLCIAGIYEIYTNFSILGIVKYIGLLVVAFLIVIFGEIKRDDDYYITLIFNHNIRDIESIADITNSSLEDVSENLETLLEDNKLKKVGIDFDTGEIRLFQTQKEANSFTKGYKDLDLEDLDHEDEYTYRCSSCGAIKNTDSKRCQYCGNKKFNKEY